MEIPFEKHVLANGLEVVLHPDRTDPVATVFVDYHVGSSREEAGCSGFAHLFEHMLFQGSAHVPEGDHFRRIQEAGGTLNGSTSEDCTSYFETLPSNHLELALWLESDRMGFLLPAMTQAKLDNQRDVVKNERRQNYDDRPYGRVRETVLAQLFPPDHPLSWQPIGSMEDIDRATLEDVGRFFGRWYGPENATLAIGGDFDPERILGAVEAYFADLPPGPPCPPVEPRPVVLEETRRVRVEDRIQVPQLTLAWPTVHAWHEDEAALTLLADVLSANRSAILDRVLVVEEQLASHVAILHRATELGGVLAIDLRPHAGVPLEVLERRTEELLAQTVEGGVEPARLERLRNRREGQVLRALDTVSARTGVLAHYNVLRGDPGLLAGDLARHGAVTPQDVLRVARRYLHRRPRVVVETLGEGSS